MNYFRQIFFFLLLFGCGNPQTEYEKIITPNSTAAKIDSSKIIVEEIPDSNYRDKNGLKQGKWITYNKGKLCDIKTYRNDTLNGYFKENPSGGCILEQAYFKIGNYLDGKLNGYIKTFDKFSKEPKFLEYYENGTRVWLMFPSADIEIMDYKLIKGIIISEIFYSVYVKAPYNNENIWYEGKVIKPNTRIGTHNIYFQSGKLKFEVNYSKQTIKQFTEEGKLLKDTDIVSFVKEERENERKNQK